jgi:class 3 adenylate cyclase
MASWPNVLDHPHTIAHMEARREIRLVTSVFIDVVGSTDATLRLGPERMQRALASAFSSMSEIISEEGGVTEKYIGDAVFAIFGAPDAHPDDPMRGLRAAERCAAWISQPVAGQPSPGLAVRIGIETGEVLVDLDALDTRQRMVVGE